MVIRLYADSGLLKRVFVSNLAKTASHVAAWTSSSLFTGAVVVHGVVVPGVVGTGVMGTGYGADHGGCLCTPSGYHTTVPDTVIPTVTLYQTL